MNTIGGAVNHYVPDVALTNPLINKQTKIAVLCGGLSNEREVSLRSGSNCFAALQRLGYENVEMIDVSTDLPQVLLERQIKIAVLALHGKFGEDGSVQGMLEMLRIPYTGSGVLASALAMNKEFTKQVLKSHDIPYPYSVVVRAEDLQNYPQLEDKLPAVPAFVKPLSEGSSVGVEKIEDAQEIRSALEKLIAAYGGAIIESMISGPEITVGVLEEKEVRNGAQSSRYIALPILELRPKSKAGFYDYEAKYTKGLTDFVLPAELDLQTTRLAQEIAIKTFKALGCSGYGRVDMLVSTAGQPFVLEVNTLPGMTDTSDLPAMCLEFGISYDALVERILMSAGLDKS